ncbi:hypothetical protein [Clostridium sp. JS66]|uniref:hypothetical protein n=1 Tax=Clostridium sp. JS66 TaxID=3064705 RepID=UPI00298E7B5B|nr:hypothetical protein [Clostridium sp. JS66]WPC42623.1 hypothetical protein Q6H37_03895 [Clostridium sp. JS66]
MKNIISLLSGLLNKKDKNSNSEPNILDILGNLDKGSVKRDNSGLENESKSVCAKRLDDFENYINKNCVGMQVITDMIVENKPGYMRVTIKEADIDVTYNPRATDESAEKWGDDWFMPSHKGAVYD